MKILFTTTFFSLMFIITKAQKITISELVNFQKNNAEYFEQEALKKGFEYSSTQDENDFTSISYELYQLKGKRNAHFLQFVTFEPSDRMVSYRTTERSEFIQLRTQSKALGFKYFKTEKLENEIIDYFKKEKLCIGFSTEVNKTDQDAEDNLFQIEVRPLSLVQN